jgi:hypothetical protein
MSIPMAAKRVGVTDQTFCRWRTRYGAEARRGHPSVHLDRYSNNR